VRDLNRNVQSIKYTLLKFFVEGAGISTAYLGFRGPQVQISVQKPGTLKQVILRFLHCF